MCGNIRKYIATTLARYINYRYCCKKNWLYIATKHVLVVIAQFLPQNYSVAITITYFQQTVHSW
jgi:hypothetical protein